ncbi:MAG: hypothetical protein AB1480_01205 [Nitrospirota bacterium]
MFVGRTAEFIKLPPTVGGTEGWQYFIRNIIVEERDTPLNFYHFAPVSIVFI